MQKIIAYKPSLFLLGIILGILLQVYFGIWTGSFFMLFLILFIGVLLLLVFNTLNSKIAFTISVFFFCIGLGVSTSFIKNTKNYNNYFYKYYTKTTSLKIEIKEVLKSNNYYYRYIARVVQVSNKNTRGTILVQIKKDSTITALQVGKQLYVYGEIKEISKPLNPHQFDYKQYLERQYVYCQMYIAKNNYKLLTVQKTSIYTKIVALRKYIMHTLKQYDFSKNELGVFYALLLGQKEEITKDLFQNYIDAGAVHILAISGLHIGILLLLLRTIFKPLLQLPKGDVVLTVLLVLFLWFFAILAGLSPSVVRAVTMFSFVAVSITLGQKQPIEHALVSSMFVLILVNPMYLFSVGFQLSYLAVFAIVWLQPILYNLYHFKWKILDDIWKLLTVSLAAQIGVLPLSLYYFHQFSVFFLLVSVLVIPFLGGVLIFGVLVIILALCNILPSFVVTMYNILLFLLNTLITNIAANKMFVFTELPMSFIVVSLSYVFLFFVYQFLVLRKAFLLYPILFVFIGIQLVLGFEKFKRNEKEELLVFHKQKRSVLGYRKGKELIVTKNFLEDRILLNYKIKENIAVKPWCISSVFSYKKDTVICVDSLGVYDVGIKNAIVLLQYSPKINMSRLLEDIQPKKVIADGSNYKSYIARWEKTCEKNKTPFYTTGKNGAYVLK